MSRSAAKSRVPPGSAARGRDHGSPTTPRLSSSCTNCSIGRSSGVSLTRGVLAHTPRCCVRTCCSRSMRAGSSTRHWPRTERKAPGPGRPSGLAPETARGRRRSSAPRRHAAQRPQVTKAAGSGVPVHPGTAGVEQDRTAGPVADGGVDRAADCWRQWDEDGLVAQPGLPERRTHDYVRHGTTTLFAALEIATGIGSPRTPGSTCTSPRPPRPG